MLVDGTVTTSGGRVRGVASNGCWSFLGIPYAASVAGDRRFMPPAAPEPWVEIRDATSPSPIAPQPLSGVGSYLPGDPMEQGEDCLSLNVWSEDLRAPTRPVIVFFHGGAFVSGTGSGVMYRGDHFAQRGVVLVTINYRLGVLGFLAHPALDTGERRFANRGLLDQLAAVRWVIDNIAAFGGDASNITLVGESAGAMSIADLLASGVLSGLVRRVILESGAFEISTSAEAFAMAERLCELLGLSEPEPGALERVPLRELLAAQDVVIAERGGAASMPFRPIVDGRLLLHDSPAAIGSGAMDGVDLLVGTNRDEFRLFTFAQPELAGLDDHGLATLAGRYLADANIDMDARDVVECFRSTRSAGGRSPSAREIFEAIGTDLVFRLPLIRLVSAHSRRGGRAYFYRFDWGSPFAQGALGACHALELPFVFGTLDNPIISLFSGADERATSLSDQMQSAWVSFARNGTPTSDDEQWPEYDETTRMTKIFGGDVELESGPGEAERVFLEPHLVPLGEAAD